MQRNIERDKKLAQGWKDFGPDSERPKFKTKAAMARMYRVPFHAVKRAIERDQATANVMR